MGYESFLGGAAGLFSVHGGGDQPGLVAVIDKVLERLSSFGEPGGGFELFPGLQALGSNVHPILVHYPIAFLSAFVVLEILGLFRFGLKYRAVATGLLFLGTLGAFAAVIAGVYASHRVAHGQVVHEIMEWHERSGILVLLLSLALSGWRYFSKARPITGMAKALYLSLSLLMLTGLLVGADLGGEMVYRHGVAVQQLQTENAAAAHQHGGQ